MITLAGARVDVTVLKKNSNNLDFDSHIYLGKKRFVSMQAVYVLRSGFLSADNSEQSNICNVIYTSKGVNRCSNFMMLCCCGSALRTQIETWLRDYDKIQSSAVILLYVQIGCALIGSLGALYNGVLLIDFVIALFALIAIESSSQSLGRTYAVLLFCSILLDISWFILFAHEIWHISSEIYGTFVIFSVKLTLSMQIVGFSVRLSSSFLWIQMYRLGVSYLETSDPREADADLRNSFLNPATPSIDRHPSGSDDVLGGSIYDPAYYSSLFEDSKDDAYLYGDGQNHAIVIESTTIAESSQVKPSLGRTVPSKDDEDAARGL